MLAAAHGLDAPAGGRARAPRPARLRRGGADAPRRARGLARARRRARAARTSSRRSSARRCALAGPGEAGRVAVLDLLRARTRRFDVVFVLGLEEGSLPRRGRGLAVPRRRRAPRARRPAAAGSRGPTRSRATATSSTRRARARSRRLYLVREAATDDGSPREPSPFWEEVARALRPRRRRALDACGGRSRRSRGRSSGRRPSASGCARWRRSPRPIAAPPRRSRRRTAGSGGSSGRSSAFRRPTRLTHPARARGARARSDVRRHRARALRRLLVGVVRRAALDPRSIDAEADAKLRGSVAHTALHRFFAGLPKELGIERVDAENARRRARVHARLPRRGARGRPAGADRAAAARARRRRCGATSSSSSATRPSRELPLVPRRFEVSFGTERSAPELQRGLDLGGGDAVREDRPDRRRPVRRPRDRPGLQVGQARRTRRPRSSRSCGCRSRSTCSCCATSSGSSRSAASTGRSPASASRAGCCARRRARTACPASRRTTTSTRRRSGRRSSGARDAARGFAERIRAGDVHHDPKGGDCPSWCDLWPMCRVRRA